MKTTPRRSILAAVLVLCAAAVPAALRAAAAGNPADAILGVWKTEAGDKGGAAQVRITRSGTKYVGTIIALDEPSFVAPHARAGRPKVDLENPDPQLRERPILGLQILSGFSYDDGKWTGGTIYDPANGKTYRAQMSLDGRDRLDVRGYVGVPMLGRTTTWRRVSGG